MNKNKPQVREASGKKASQHTVQTNLYQAQDGFTLLLMLIFVIFFGGVISTLVFNKNNTELRTQARATGLHVAEIARAARIFVRDRSLDDGDFATLAPASIYHRHRLAPAALAIAMPAGGTSTGPNRAITVADLIGAGLLPNGFGQTNGAGDYITPLGQEIRIIAANSPILDDPRVNLNTVATAYVYLVANPRTRPELVSDIVNAMRQDGVAVSAPRFNAAGVNVTGIDCGGTPAVAAWDTGCLSNAEFLALSGEAFVPGSLVIPTWRSVQFDLRAVMRYPQPENPGYATMLTDLRMGTQIDTNGDGVCDDVDQIAVNDDTGTVNVGICRVEDDDNTEVLVSDQDKRFDIRNVNTLTADGMIITPQGAGGDVRTNVEAGTGNILLDTTVENVQSATLSEGLLVSGQAIVRSDIRVYDTVALPAGERGIQMNGDLGIRRNIVLSDPGATDPNQPDLTVGTVNVDTLNAEDFHNENVGATFDPDSMRLSTLDAAGDFTLTAGGTAAMEEVDILSPDVTAQTAVMTGITRVTNVSTGTSGATLGGGLRAVVAEMHGRNSGATNVTGNLAVSQDRDDRSAVFGGRTITNSLNISNGAGDARCFGDCPDRRPDPDSPF